MMYFEYDVRPISEMFNHSSLKNSIFGEKNSASDILLTLAARSRFSKSTLCVSLLANVEAMLPSTEPTRSCPSTMQKLENTVMWKVKGKQATKHE